MNNNATLNEPTVSVSLTLYYTDKVINKLFEICKSTINDFPWCYGTTNDPYYDDLNNNDDRFIFRVNDVLHHLINQDEQLDDWDKWEIDYIGEYDLDEFTA